MATVNQEKETYTAVADRLDPSRLSGPSKADERRAYEQEISRREQREQNKTARLLRLQNKNSVLLQREGAEKKRKKKLTGPVFWLVVGCALLKDTLDLFLHLTVVLSILIVFFNFLIAFIIAFYLIFNLVKPSIRKSATLVIGGVAEFIPIISILPITTLSLFAVRYFENSESKHKEKLIGHFA